VVEGEPTLEVAGDQFPGIMEQAWIPARSAAPGKI